MFGIWSQRRIQILDHWFVLVDDFETSTPEFYESVTSELEARQMPGLQIQTMEFPEGGSLSQSRVYLRLRRERLIFDICSAPFGTSWFFSCRFGEIPIRLRIWEIIVMAVFLLGLYGLFVWLFGYLWGSLLLVLNILGAIFLLNTLIASGIRDLDAILIRIPVAGAFYERFFRRSTYYRNDTRTMYSTAVDRVVRDAVQRFAGDSSSTKVNFESGLTRTALGVRGRIKMMFDALWPSSTSV